MTAPPVVVAGAGHAAIQLAASLRQGGYDGDITLVDAEAGLPYQRPPLSKAYLSGEMDESKLPLRPESFFAAQRVGRVEGDPVAAIERRRHEVVLTTGRRLEYGHLVLATGGASRILAVPGAELPGVTFLRSFAEAQAVKAKLPELKRVVVIGTGYIGLEFAAVAALRGIGVTVIGRSPKFLMRRISDPMADHLEAVHRGWGSRLLLSSGPKAIHGTSHAEAVETRDGEVLPADLVLVAIGVEPATHLAAAAGLRVDDGIVVDAHLLTDDPAVSAIGDCASFPLPDGRRIRLESVQNASDQARAVAERLLGRSAPYNKVPWFWSDQGPLKLQIAGLPAEHDGAVLRGDPASGSFSVFCFREGRLIAVESLNRVPDHMPARRILAATPRITPAEAADPKFDLRAAL